MTMAGKISLLVLGILSLSACSTARDALGIDREAPDEFTVVRQAPLEMPSTIALPPPNPGQPRPQETAPTKQAKGVIFGEPETHTVQNVEASGAESALLQKTGADQSDPNIRAELDAESVAYAEKNKPVVKKLLGIGGMKTQNNEEALNPKAEAERLRGQNLPAPLPPEEKKNKEE